MKKLIIILIIPAIWLQGCDFLKQSEKNQCSEDAHELSNTLFQESKAQTEELLNEIGEIKKNGTALHFTDVHHIRKVASLLSHLSDDELDKWEESIGFNSQRRFNNEKMKSEDIDDFEFEKQRINLGFIESLFNDKGVVFVDTLKIVHKGNRAFESYNINSNEIIDLSTIMMNNSNIIPCSDCRQGKFQHCDRYFYNGNYKVVGTKWNEGYFFYASVGFRTKYYLKNHKGKWKVAYAPNMLGANLDQWHHVQICDGIWGGATNYSSIRKEKYNSPHHVEKVIKWGMFRQNYCVPHFGRVHHWKDDDYNNDAHCEPNNW